MIDELLKPAAAWTVDAREVRTATWKRGYLWREVERLAREASAREPALRPLLAETVLSQTSPEAIVAATLARRLCRPGAPAATLRELVLGAFEDDAALRRLFEADLVAVLTRDPACRSVLHALLHLKGFHALQWHRVAHALWRSGRLDAAEWLQGLVSLTLAIDIHPAARIGAGVVFDHGSGIVIGETASIDDDVTLLHGVTLGATGTQRGDRHPKVRRGAFIGAGAIVLGAVEIGAMSRVAAGAVVLNPVPQGSTVAGVPARIVRRDAVAGRATAPPPIVASLCG